MTDQRTHASSGSHGTPEGECQMQMIAVEVRDNHRRDLRYKPKEQYNVWDTVCRDDDERERSEDADAKAQALVHVFGRDDRGRSTCLLVTGFRPWLYLRVPDSTRRAEVDRMLKNACLRLRCTANTDVSATVVRATHFKGWECSEEDGGAATDARRRVFVQFSCRTVELRRRLAWTLDKGRADLADGRGGVFDSSASLADEANYTLHEHKFEPWQQFLAWSKLQASGWIAFDEAHCAVPDECVTTCARELLVDASRLRRVDERHDIAPFVVCSFDIECYTPDDRFPVPTEDAHLVVQIGVVHWSFGRPFEGRRAHVFCLGDTAPIEPLATADCPKEADVAAPVAVTASCHDTQLALIAAFARHVADVDPDVVIGYNTDQFDWRFLSVKAHAAGGVDAVRAFRFSRVRSDHAYVNLCTKGNAQKGLVDVCYPEMNGRVCMDLLPKFRDDFKMRTYSLDHVSAKVLGARKADLVAAQIFAQWRAGPDGRAVVARYCAQDCDLVLRLLRRKCLLQGLVELSRATSTPADYVSRDGEQTRFLAQVYLTCHALGMVVNDVNVAKRAPGDAPAAEKYQGAEVLQPAVGFYVDPVATLDFNSLYPSIIMCHNLCPSTILLAPGALERAQARGLRVETFELDGERHSFVQDREGVLPQLLRNLLARRSEAKVAMEAAERAGDEESRAIYDARQLAFKVSANSIYGSMGCQTGKLYLKAVAACVTKIGRDGLMRTRDFVTTRMSAEFVYGAETARALWGVEAAAATFARVIYGDTDSVMIQVPTHPAFVGDVVPVAFAAAQRMAALITAELFRRPMKLAFEKIYRPFALFAKKVYAGIKYTRPDAPESVDGKVKVELKGMCAGKRNTIPFVAALEVRMLECALLHADPERALRCLDEAFAHVASNDVDYQDFCITKRVKSALEYGRSNPDVVAQVVLNRKLHARNPGSEYAVGDRASFVFVAPKHGDRYLADRAEDPAYAKEHGLKLDVALYLRSHVQLAVVRILELLFPGQGEQIFNARRVQLLFKVSGQRTLADMGVFAARSDPLALPPPVPAARAPPKPPSAPPAQLSRFFRTASGAPVEDVPPRPPPPKRKSPPKAPTPASKKQHASAHVGKGSISAFMVPAGVVKKA